MSTQILDENQNIKTTPLADALSQRYLSYALSTIMSRSLPDVRDGLKPVHRRLLFAMRELKLNPENGYKKAARVVGDVMGKYHPHGDMSIYDALVRLAQDFSVRYPLVDGQGNFGNIDGDNAAAMRYTEARLTHVAKALLDGIDEGTVDFRNTYDGEGAEPLVLPSAFPNLLANGATGIAVGMATNIPPHNVGEICDALLHLIKFPNATVAKLIDFMPGPDFPTGGELVEDRETIIETYKTGRGSLRVRATWKVEKLKGGSYEIIITEIPYQVQKAKLIERIADIITTKKLPVLEDIRDESAEDIRIVLVPKNRTVEPEMLMESLFKTTDLESRFNLNMNALDKNNIPQIMSLREVLQAFLDHRHVVLIRRSNFQLEKINHRLEILEGYLIAYLNLDKVIKIIREEDEPKPVLMKTFKLTDIQAEAILNMRLRALRKLEQQKIQGEHDELSAQKKSLEKLLKDEKIQWETIADEIKTIKKDFGEKTDLGKRRTVIGSAPTEIDMPIEAFIEKEPVTIILSEKGWIRAMKGHVENAEDIKHKEGDSTWISMHAQTTDKILVFAADGKFYTLGVDKLPGARGFGEPLRLMVDVGDHKILSLHLYKENQKLLVVSNDGRGFVVEQKDIIAHTKNGKQILNLDEKAKAAKAVPADGDVVAVIGDARKLLLFKTEELPAMTRGKGVILQKYKEGGLSDVVVFNFADGLKWPTAGKKKQQTQSITHADAEELQPYLGKRAQVGKNAPWSLPWNNKFDGK